MLHTQHSNITNTYTLEHNTHQTGTKPIDRALAQAGLKKEHIDEVLLVGGSTRMPRIHSELRCYFENCPKTRLSFSMRSGEPVKAVAVGAAYYGQSLMSSFSREDDGESEQRISQETFQLYRKIVSSG